MLNKIIMLLFGLSLITSTAIGSPTLSKEHGERWKLNPAYPPVYDFIIETCNNFYIDDISVVVVLSEEYEKQLYQYEEKTKKNRVEALERTLGWCRYWRDLIDRKLLTPEWIAKRSKAECFFRSLERR